MPTGHLVDNKLYLMKSKGKYRKGENKFAGLLAQPSSFIWPTTFGDFLGND